MSLPVDESSDEQNTQIERVALVTNCIGGLTQPIGSTVVLAHVLRDAEPAREIV